MKISAKTRKMAKKSSITLGIVTGLAAIPVSVAIGLGVGIKDDVIDSSFSSAITYGQKFFDNSIVKVQDDTFTSNILYTFDKNENLQSDKLTDDELEKEKLSVIGDISGLVRLDRKLDIQYVKSVVNLDSEDYDGGKIQTDGSLIFDFNNIEEDVLDENGIRHFGKDKITEYEVQARATLSAAVKKYQEKHKEDKTMHFGVFFDKHASSRRVSIYLYELKKFEEEGELDEQGKLINDFVNDIDSTIINDENWADIWNYYDSWAYKTNLDKLERVKVDNFGNPVPYTSDTLNGLREQGFGGFPEIFAGPNLFKFSSAHWYNLGWKYANGYDEIGVSADGKTMLKNKKPILQNETSMLKNKKHFMFKNKKIKKDDNDFIVKEPGLDGWSWHKADFNDNPYFNNFVDENNNKFLGNTDINDKLGHSLGAYQFAIKGLFVTIRPALDYVNDVLKVIFTFKSFREKGMNSSRTLLNYNLTDDISNPYKVSTFIRKIPLARFGNEGEHGEKEALKIDSPKSRDFKPLYLDETTHITPGEDGYIKLKDLVLKSSFKPLFKDGNIGKEEAKEVIKRFYSDSLSKFVDIPIVSPGLGILGKTMPELGSALASWVELGKISSKLIKDPTSAYSTDYTFDPENYKNHNGNKVTYKLLKIFDNDEKTNPSGYKKADELLEKIISICDEKQPLRSTSFVNTMNNFSPIAWSDLNSLIGLKGYTVFDERTSRTFELFHLVFGTSVISDLIANQFKEVAPEIYAGNYTTIIDDLLKWLKENGVIKKSTSLMDLIADYKNQLGTIIEAIGINKPRMDIKMIKGIINLIPLDLFSDSNSTFNKDTALMLDYLLNVGTSFSNIVNLLHGNGRTSPADFLSHIFNDTSDSLLKYIGGVLGASYSNTTVFSNAFHSIINMLKAGGDTFGGVGKALENIYDDGINSIKLESIESILNFIDFIGPSFGLDSLSASGVKIDEVSQSIFKFIDEGVSKMTASDLEPITSFLNPLLKGVLSYGDDITSDVLSEVMLHLFNGWPDAKTLSQELVKLIPSIVGTRIDIINLTVPELIEVIYENDINKLGPIPKSLLVVDGINHLEIISKLLHKGLSGMTDNDWSLFVDSAGIIVDAIIDFKNQIGISDDIVNILNLIFKDANSVKTLQSIGRIFSDGLSKLEVVDYENIVDTILNLVIHLGGNSISDFIDAVNEGNPSQKEGVGTPRVDPNAFRNLILGFIVGHK